MAWDPALLRKFNATGHFRLLNQVRSELKANPIKRAAPSAADQANSRGVATGKPLDLRSQGYGRRRSSASSSSGPSSSPAQASPSPTPPAPLPVAPLPETTAVAAAEPSPWGKRRSSASAASPKAPTLESGFQSENNPPTEGSSQLEASSPAEAGSRSFRDRLNAIQMR
jgi:hypothetical protein